MALILCIETSTNVCSVALSQNGDILELRESFNDQSHSARLTVFIQDIFDKVSFKLNDLDAIAVCGGPGSYTGLRIGVATAKGLCYSLDKPLIAIDSLMALAQSVVASRTLSENELLIPMIDARRMEVYTAVFNSDLDVLETTHPRVIEASSFSTLTHDHTLTLFGNGADKCKEILTNEAFTFVDGIFCSAKGMAVLANEKYKINDCEELAYYEPNYLKIFSQKIKTK